MNNQCIVNNKDLTAIADSIRTKTGASEPLLFPNGFSDAINGIQTGSAIANPYVEEIYDQDGKLLRVQLNGQTELRDFLFYNCSELANAELQEGILTIGDSVFAKCSKLAITSLPESITTIGDQAFYNCYELALTSLPENITTIGTSAFSCCAKIVFFFHYLTLLPTLEFMRSQNVMV